MNERKDEVISRALARIQQTLESGACRAQSLLKAKKENAMTLPLAPREVYIRLDDAEMALVCTIRLGELLTSVTKFSVGPLSCIGPEEKGPDLSEPETDSDPQRL